MLFRAVVVDDELGSRNQTGYKIDPWEELLFRKDNVLPFHGPLQTNVWYHAAWPAILIATNFLVVGHEGAYTLFRRQIDIDREQRWKNGETFQVNSLTE